MSQVRSLSRQPYHSGVLRTGAFRLKDRILQWTDVRASDKHVLVDPGELGFLGCVRWQLVLSAADARWDSSKASGSRGLAPYARYKDMVRGLRYDGRLAVKLTRPGEPVWAMFSARCLDELGEALTVFSVMFS